MQLIPLSQPTDMMMKTSIAMMMTIMNVMVMITIATNIWAVMILPIIVLGDICDGLILLFCHSDDGEDSSPLALTKS